MGALKPPDAIHGKAIDLATEGDRVWFEQNPDRLHRLRDVMPFENNGPVELPPDGMTWKVIVTQIKSGMRFRMLVEMPDDLPNEGVDDKHLTEIIKKAAPPEFKRILKAATKDRKKGSNVQGP